jgi:regulator of cell morphogenesis and NO signaling
MTVDGRIDPVRSLGALVAARPARAELFERLRLDYCCGGHQTLEEACHKRGLDPQMVRATLEAFDGRAPDENDRERTDWRAATTVELCEHIVSVHHGGLREAFPRIEELLGTVVGVHGSGDPRLRDVQRVFREIRCELEPHLASEEAELFPACVDSERSGALLDQSVVDAHQQEHASLGQALTALRAVCHDYDRGHARCRTHRRLLDELEAFERDLHRHVHEENNILLPRVRTPRGTAVTVRSTGQGREAMGAVSESLAPCCQGWIAEQTHRCAARGG